MEGIECARGELGGDGGVELRGVAIDFQANWI